MLEVRSLEVAYNGRLVLQGVSLRVKAGEVLALIGPNGAGKTTLIRAISGVVLPQRGEVFIEGRALLRLTPSERARHVAVVPQAQVLPPLFTVYETVLLGRTPYIGWMGRISAQDQALVRQALAHTHLDHLAEVRLERLSGGEHQRVLLARALAQDTDVILLDEPTAHLDIHHQAEMLNLVRRLAHEQGRAVLMALHDLNLAALYADRVALLAEGRLQAVGTPPEVITTNNLRRVYGLPFEVIPHPRYGVPLILPDGRRAPEPEKR